MKIKKEFLTPTEAAPILGFIPNTITKMIREGKIKASKAGRGYLIPRAEITRVLKREPEIIPESSDKECYLVKNESVDILNERIHHLESALIEQKKQNEFLARYVDVMAGEKIKMLETMTINARLLEIKDVKRPASCKLLSRWPFKR